MIPTSTYPLLQFGGITGRVLMMARAGTVRIDCSEAILVETVGVVLRDKFGWEGYRLHFAALELRRIANFVAPA